MIVKDVRKLEPVFGKNWNFRIIDANVDLIVLLRTLKQVFAFGLWRGTRSKNTILLGGLSVMRVGLNKNHYLSSPLL